MPILFQKFPKIPYYSLFEVCQCLILKELWSKDSDLKITGMNESVLDKTYREGDSGLYVKLIQEWLCFNGIGIVIDGDFGPATDSAVRKFQLLNLLDVDGIIGPNTFNKLIEPITRVQRSVPINGRPLNEMVAEYARQHFRERPREIGGQNMGPWVRYYMRGNEGVDWPWCAGFISAIIRQACKSLRIAFPLKLSDSCIELSKNAKASNLFLSEAELRANRSKLQPGAVFLNRTRIGYWSHTGIVVAVEDNVFHTIEGNTNDDGSAEGYEVCLRIRNYDTKDFIII